MLNTLILFQLYTAVYLSVPFSSFNYATGIINEETE